MYRSPIRFTTALLGFALAACGGTTTTDDGIGENEIELSYSGIREGDEPPRFADPEVEAEEARDREVRPGDDAATTRDVEEVRTRPDSIGVIVELRYGDLLERSETPGGIWRFRIAAVGGLIHSARVLTDEGEEANLHRITRSEIGFSTGTRPGDTDGARVMIEYTPDGGREGLTVVTEGLALGLPLRELIDHRSLHRTRQGEVAIHAFAARPDRPDRPDRPTICAGGMVHARVAPLGDDGVGRIFGVVTNHAGDRIGHFRGAYGVRENGNHVLFGKIINREGGQIGRVRGTFERTDVDTAVVRARIHFRRGERANGVMRGIMANIDGRGGRLEARWALDCDGDETIDRSDLPSDRDDEEATRR